MDRIIKFRVWDSVGNRWMDVFEVNLLDFNYLNNPEYTIQQFTGLSDSKGKEIYEGDIIKYLPPEHDTVKGLKIGEIYWEESQFMLDRRIQYYLRIIKNLEIIGNIFENPELLK